MLRSVIVCLSSFQVSDILFEGGDGAYSVFACRLIEGLCEPQVSACVDDVAYLFCPALNLNL